MRLVSSAPLLATLRATLRTATRNLAPRRSELSTSGTLVLAPLGTLPLPATRTFHASLLPSLTAATTFGAIPAPLYDGSPLLSPLLPRVAIAAAIATLGGPFTPALDRSVALSPAAIGAFLASISTAVNPVFTPVLPAIGTLFPTSLNAILTPILPTLGTLLTPLATAIGVVLASPAGADVVPMSPPVGVPIGAAVVPGSLPVVAVPVGVEREGDDRDVYSRPVRDQRHVAFPIVGAEIVGRDPASCATPGYIAPRIGAYTAVHRQPGAVRNDFDDWKVRGRSGAHVEICRGAGRCGLGHTWRGACN